jgi:hypothetical protein
VLYGEQEWVYEPLLRRLELKPAFEGLEVLNWPYLPFNIPPLKMFGKAALPEGRSVEDYYPLSGETEVLGILTFAVTSKTLDYLPALAYYGREGNVNSFRLTDRLIVNFQGYRSFQGVSLPEHITRNWYKVSNAPPNVRPKLVLGPKPEATTTFDLVSCSSAQAPPGAFDIASYVKPNTAVFVNQFVYRYSPADGDFYEVLDKQLKLRKQPPLHKKGSHLATVAFVSVAGLAALITARGLKKRAASA